MPSISGDLSLEISQAAGPGQSPLKQVQQNQYPPKDAKEWAKLLPVEERIRFAQEVGIDTVKVTVGKDKGKVLSVDKVSWSSRHKSPTLASDAVISFTGKIYFLYCNITDQIVNYFKTKAASGNGLFHHKIVKNKKVFRGSGFMSQVDDTAGVPRQKPYIPFGRHFLNREKLGNNILMIKRNGSNTIAALPTTRITNELKKVVEELMQGMNPAFGNIYGLTDDEKNLYNRIILHTGIDQRLKIPAPELDEEQKDWHRYSILLGEIEAGNSNPVLVKELKVLLVKMSNKKMLPKAEVRSVLLDLTALGF